MFGGEIGFWEILIILIAGVVLFGKSLPDVGRSLGKSPDRVRSTAPAAAVESRSLFRLSMVRCPRAAPGFAPRPVSCGATHVPSEARVRQLTRAGGE